VEGAVKRRRGGGRGRERAGGGGAAEVEISSIAAGGEGVGRLGDGRVVFVHRTAPGDRARVALAEERARWARGRLLEVLDPSPLRRAAPCAHYGECGGCTLEHLRYEAQLEAKGRIVADALRRIGGAEVEAPVVVPSPGEFRYRNRVSFALRRLRGAGVVAGFHALGDPGRIVDLDGSCLLPEAAVARAWDQLRAGWGEGADRLPAGERLRLTLRATESGEVSLLVEGGSTPGEPQALLEAVPALASVWHRPGPEPAALVAGAPGLPETWGEETVALSGAAFLQVNRAAARLLEEHVVGLAGEVAGARVVDAYCGVGFHARRLARAGAEVVGIELDPDAVAAARALARPGTRFEHGAVEAVLPSLLPADLVILNPPRAGVAPTVVDQLLAEPPARIVYVSCDPATLARDLRRLAERYDLGEVRAFDLFPQTAHVETVAALAIRTLS
jgi:23S rRNA (uracil1939-C5)-methyltransferase